jgi:hypothetical protein
MQTNGSSFSVMEDLFGSGSDCALATMADV